MFSAIKPTGALPLSGHTGHTPLTGAGQNKNIAERQHYDQFQRSVQLSDEQQKIQETVSSLSKQARMRPTRSQLESLQKQIQDGTYQPSATEIAARMLMIYDQED